MLEIKTIETVKYEKVTTDRGTYARRVGLINPVEAFEQLKAHLEKVNLLPDEYFMMSVGVESMKELPDFYNALCYANYGGSEGIYLDVVLNFYENNQKKELHFITGKTLAEDGDAFLHMSRIAAECSLMLNSNGSIVKVSEKNYEGILDKQRSGLDKTITLAKERTNSVVNDSTKSWLQGKIDSPQK